LKFFTYQSYVIFIFYFGVLFLFLFFYLLQLNFFSFCHPNPLSSKEFSNDLEKSSVDVVLCSPDYNNNSSSSSSYSVILKLIYISFIIAFNNALVALIGNKYIIYFLIESNVFLGFWIFLFDYYQHPNILYIIWFNFNPHGLSFILLLVDLLLFNSFNIYYRFFLFFNILFFFLFLLCRHIIFVYIIDIYYMMFHALYYLFNEEFSNFLFFFLFIIIITKKKIYLFIHEFQIYESINLLSFSFHYSINYSFSSLFSFIY
jgi:hypothetical protein